MTRRISPTRLKLYEECSTKYYYEEVKGFRNEKIWHAFGSYAHKVAEALLWEKINAPRTYDKLADDLLKIKGDYDDLDTTYATEIGRGFADLTLHDFTPVAVEADIRVELSEGYYDCQIDCIARKGDQTVVVDHKTSVNPYKYAKTEQQLRADVQAQLYAYAVMWKYDVSEVLAHWHWLPRKRFSHPMSKAVVTEVLFRRDELEEVAKKYCKLGSVIVNLDSRPAPIWTTDFLKSLDVCGAFGGCPHYKRCREDEEAMGMLDDLGIEPESPEVATVNPQPEKAPVTATAAPQPVTAQQPTDNGDLDPLEAVEIAKAVMTTYDIVTLQELELVYKVLRQCQK